MRLPTWRGNWKRPHTQSSHPKDCTYTCTCASVGADTGWPSECSAEERYNNNNSGDLVITLSSLHTMREVPGMGQVCCCGPRPWCDGNGNLPLALRSWILQQQRSPWLHFVQINKSHRFFLSDDVRLSSKMSRVHHASKNTTGELNAKGLDPGAFRSSFDAKKGSNRHNLISRLMT